MQSTWSVNGVAGGVDPRDRGLAYGDGLFETMAVREGQVPWLDRHLERLALGCERLEIPLPPLADLRAAVARHTPEHGRAVVKLIVTRGVGARGYRPPHDPHPTVIVGSFEWPTQPVEHYTRGIAMITCETRLSENPKLAGLKHLCRLEQVLAQLELRQYGADEGLMLSTSEHVVSATSHNVFAVYGDRVRTPSIERCGVRGVMRQLVLEACPALALEAEETTLDLDTLSRADEVFLSNSVLGIRPVRRLDGIEFRIGPVAHRIGGVLGHDGNG